MLTQCSIALAISSNLALFLVHVMPLPNVVGSFHSDFSEIKMLRNQQKGKRATNQTIPK
jgi:hypothetical protein